MEMSSAVSRPALKRVSLFRFVVFAATLGAFGFLQTSCSSGPKASIASATKVTPDVQVLNPGDVIKISFPGATNLDTTQQIRRDGRVNLYMIGEVKAADKSPSELEKELVQAYSNQLLSKEVKVTVVSSSFAVYVTGAVMKPGKILPERALTAFDAIMEAGGFDTAKADTKSVRVIRQEDGQVKTYVLNIKALLEGAQTEPFYLKSHDSVYVPEKFSWF